MLKENTKTKGVKRIPRWRVFLEQKINNIRRKLSFVTLILKCQDDATPLTKHQLSISNKLKKWYRNTKTRTLRSQQSKLKHELVVTSQELRNRIKVKNRNTINTQFRTNQKQLYRKWKGKKIKVENAPTLENVESFWSGVWNKKSNFNPNAKWLPTLEKEYCASATAKEYLLTNQVFQNGSFPYEKRWCSR